MLKSLESTLLLIFVQQVGISREHWLNFTMRSTLMRSSLKSFLHLLIKMISVKPMQKCLGCPLRREIQGLQLSRQSTKSSQSQHSLSLMLKTVKLSQLEVEKMCKIYKHGIFGNKSERRSNTVLILNNLYLPLSLKRRKLLRQSMRSF